MAAMGFFKWLFLTLAAVQLGWKVCRRAAEEMRLHNAFEDFAREHGRAYGSREEKRQRYAIFKANLLFIEAENAKDHSYTLGINDLADQAPEEIQASHLGISGPSPLLGQLWGAAPHLGTDRYSGAELPDAVDWSEKGAVTAPKNQGGCGSCWAFSTTGALEGAWAISSGKIVALSEQQLVDCARSSDMAGCSGGAMDPAFKYFESHGVCSEDSYPYKAKSGTCAERNCSVAIPKGSVTGFRDVPAQDTKALMEAVSKQPVAVAIEADQLAFQLYHGGVLHQTCGAKLDHGVLIVGYGTDKGMDYWKVKNSWGANWGEQGYIRIKRGVPKDGECGIKDQPSYPVVNQEEERSPVMGVVGSKGAIPQMLALAQAMLKKDFEATLTVQI
jgi:C1A family cysteine protease